VNNNLTEVLYYPNFNPTDLIGIKQSLLLYDRVNVIGTPGTPYFGSILSNSDSMDFTEISNLGAGEGMDIDGQNELGIIPDYEIVENHLNEFADALVEDLNDEEVLAWERKWEERQGGKKIYWFVDPEYFGRKINEINDRIVNPIYKIEYNYGLLKVPFLVGISLSISEAMWLAIDKGYTLFTDDVKSDEFLKFRLKRGWKHLMQNPSLRSKFGMEVEFSQKFATASLGAWILQTKVPDLIKEASSMSISEILELRRSSNSMDALNSFRSGISNLVQSRSLWESEKFENFEEEAYKIFNQDIKPAFEVLDRRKILSIKEIFSAFDINNAVGQGIKKIPDLFIGAAVPSAAAASALAIGGVAIAPTALLALGCGLTAHFVEKLMEKMSTSFKEKRSAQFLTYPLNLQDALTKRQ
jgi:hypothetical protein